MSLLFLALYNYFYHSGKCAFVMGGRTCKTELFSSKEVKTQISSHLSSSTVRGELLVWALVENQVTSRVSATLVTKSSILRVLHYFCAVELFYKKLIWFKEVKNQTKQSLINLHLSCCSRFDKPLQAVTAIPTDLHAENSGERPAPNSFTKHLRKAGNLSAAVVCAC